MQNLPGLVATLNQILGATLAENEQREKQTLGVGQFSNPTGHPTKIAEEKPTDCGCAYRMVMKGRKDSGAARPGAGDPSYPP